jgi:hypothetical protein
MRIDELLYFAPGVTFDQLDLGGENLPDQFESRIRGFYIAPAVDCANAGYWFAAGVLLLSCIDALARFKTGSQIVGDRFKSFARQELKSFAEENRADRLYYAFRNGLVHEGRIKAGAQFSLDTENTVDELQGAFVINPRRLADEVDGALSRYVSQLKADRNLRSQLAARLSKDHRDDLQ